jgi:hypothetical protein
MEWREDAPLTTVLSKDNINRTHKINLKIKKCSTDLDI